MSNHECLLLSKLLLRKAGRQAREEVEQVVQVDCKNYGQVEFSSLFHVKEKSCLKQADGRDSCELLDGCEQEAGPGCSSVLSIGKSLFQGDVRIAC